MEKSELLSSTALSSGTVPAPSETVHYIRKKGLLYIVVAAATFCGYSFISTAIH